MTHCPTCKEAIERGLGGFYPRFYVRTGYCSAACAYRCAQCDRPVRARQRHTEQWRELRVCSKRCRNARSMQVGDQRQRGGHYVNGGAAARHAEHADDHKAARQSVQGTPRSRLKLERRKQRLARAKRAARNRENARVTELARKGALRFGAQPVSDGDGGR